MRGWEAARLRGEESNADRRVGFAGRGKGRKFALPGPPFGGPTEGQILAVFADRANLT